MESQVLNLLFIFDAKSLSASTFMSVLSAMQGGIKVAEWPCLYVCVFLDT